MRRLILTADDFGLSEAVNEGIERAHRDGVLTAASLMVAAPAAADAISRARTMPNLRIGLHLVVIEGPAVLSHPQIPGLVDIGGKFPSNQLALGLKYFASPAIRRQLAAEIRAQFQAFANTGLTLDHVNAHKHMHLHPTIGALMIRIGAEFGLRAVRLPAEPPHIIAACGTPPTLAAHAMHRWTSLLRHQIQQAGLKTTAATFGLAWTGHMTEERLLRLIPHLPRGDSEIYFHPASRTDPVIRALMPTYAHVAERDALVSPAVREALLRNDIHPGGFGEL